jgi:hypothetical protein
MDTIRCPMCGKENASSAERCNYCNAALKPFNISETPSKSANEDDWLSSLRSDSGGIEENVPLPEGTSSGVNTPEEEEAPDWLLRIRQRMEEDNKPDQEGQEDQAAQKPEGGDAIPDWLRGLSDIPVEEGTPPQSEFISEPEREGEIPESTDDWLSRLQVPARDEKPSVQEIPEVTAGDAEQEAPIPDETEAEEWLKNLAAWQAPVSYEKPEQPTPFVSGQPDETSEQENPSFEIFRQPEHIRDVFKDEQNVPEQPEEHPVEQLAEQPDWFKALQQQVGPIEEPTTSPSEEPELPSWLQEFDRTIETSAVSGESLGEISSDQDNSLQAEPAFLEEENPLPYSEGKQGEEISAFIPEDIEIPESREEESSEIAPLAELSAPSELPAGRLPEEESAEIASGLPDWLESIQPENEEQPSPVVPPFEENILPDWLNEVQEPPESEKAPFPQVFDIYQPVDRNPKEPVSPFEVPELPEWFSDLPQQLETPSVSEIPVPVEEIAPAELPTWLKAMKPEEPRQPSSDETGHLQQSGPLAGLPEILPSAEQALTIRNTAVQAGKLLISDKQQRSADIIGALLDKLGETTTGVSAKKKAGFNWLRPVFAALLIIVILVPIIMTQPASSGFLLMSESAEAAYTAIDSLAPDQPVLLAFDFEPGYSGELSNAGRGIIQHLVKKNTRLVFVSTSATGTVLADTTLLDSLKEMPEMADQTIRDSFIANRTVNLGYLAGGTASLQEFAQNPQLAARYGLKAAMDGVPTWSLPALANIQSINDFGMVIVLTDNSETGRAWVEQVEPHLGDIPLVMAATSLAAPMLEPYYESAQINGLVMGLTDGSRYHVRITSNPSNANVELALQASAGLVAIIFFAGLVIFSIQNLRSGRKD